MKTGDSKILVSLYCAFLILLAAAIVLFRVRDERDISNAFALVTLGTIGISMLVLELRRKRTMRTIPIEARDKQK